MIDRCRDDFELLERRIDGRPVVYLDSAATALKPRAVLDAERAYSTTFTANIHRGKHALSEEASTAYEAARRRVARHLGAEPASVVFVRNTTEAMNVVARGLGLSREDVVLALASEHHSNVVPWMAEARVEWVHGSPLSPVDLDAFRDALVKFRPKVVAIGHASNVTGVINPAAELCRLAREHGALSVVDAAQSAPHLPLDVSALDCDFLAFSGHKLLAPTGIGVLYGRPEALQKLRPLVLGGGTVDRVTATGFTLKAPPWRFEAGTPNVSGALGLAAALDYLETLGFANVAAHDETLAAALASAVTDLPGVRVLMAPPGSRLALATLVPTHAKVSADHLARGLSDGYAIMTRSGFHCAHPLFDTLGVQDGSLRASAYIYNTEAELKLLGEALRALLGRLVGHS